MIQILSVLDQVQQRSPDGRVICLRMCSVFLMFFSFASILLFTTPCIPVIPGCVPFFFEVHPVRYLLVDKHNSNSFLQDCQQYLASFQAPTHRSRKAPMTSGSKCGSQGQNFQPADQGERLISFPFVVLVITYICGNTLNPKPIAIGVVVKNPPRKLKKEKKKLKKEQAGYSYSQLGFPIQQDTVGLNRDLNR